MARRRRKSSARRRSYGRRGRRMHGLGQMDLGQMDMSSMMPAGLGQFDYSSGMSTTTKVAIGAVAAFAVYQLFLKKKAPAASAAVAAEPVAAAAGAEAGAEAGAAAGAAAGAQAAEATIAKVVRGGNAASSSLFGLNGKGYFSGLGRGYYSGWQGQGDSGTDFQAAGRGYNYGRYF